MTKKFLALEITGPFFFFLTCEVKKMLMHGGAEEVFSPG